MSDTPDTSSDRISQEASAWILRSDRGLTPVEQDEFSDWLAADARHGARLAQMRQHWHRLDALVEWRPEHSTQPNPDLLAPPLRRRIRFLLPAALAIAAALVVATALFWPRPVPVETLTAVTGAPNQRILPDGTIVELNRGTVITPQFTATERRVLLPNGEAHFAVTKDPSRPFIVRTHGIDVRAVGTAFNVRVDPAAVEVLVTEGRVQLDTAAAPATAVHDTSPAAPAILEARQRAVVSLAPAAPAPQIATLTEGEIERVLAWQHRMLDFTAAPLNEVIAEFNRRNVIQLVVIDPELASVKVSATLRSDNIDGFVRLLEEGFGARAERRGDAEILLRAGR